MDLNQTPNKIHAKSQKFQSPPNTIHAKCNMFTVAALSKVILLFSLSAPPSQEKRELCPHLKN